MIHALAYSGGKDSTATLLWLREQQIPFVAVYCDTGWEHPKTVAYIEEINQTLLGGKLITLKSVKYDGMVHLIQVKKRNASAKARFCTEELKSKPMIAWVAEQEDEVTIYQGIRAQESASRARMLPQVWDDGYDAFVSRPILSWSVEDVFAMHKKYQVPVNPLYKMGHARVGCFPCVMVNQSQLRILSEQSPEVWDRIEEISRAAGGKSFFSPGYIPDRCTTGFDPKSQKNFPTNQDVKEYVLDKAQTKLDDTPSSCMSVYNICE